MSADSDAKQDYGRFSYCRIAQGIGTFADDPPETEYQKAYLAALCRMFVAKLQSAMLTQKERDGRGK
jgi:hypothetical protein